MQSQQPLLRTRIPSSTPGSSQTAPLLPRPSATSPQAQHVPQSWQLWVVRVILLSGTLYAVLLLCWSANRLGLVSSDKTLTTNDWAQNTEELGYSRKEDGSDDEDVSSDELLWGQVAEDNTLVTLNTNLPADPSSPSPPTPEKHIKAMQLAREKIRIQNLLPHMHNTLSAFELEAKAREAEAHAKSVKVLPTNETAPRQFRCVGWRATGDCSPDGPREPERDQPCTKLIAFGEAGYCEIEDERSGKRFRALRRHCNSLKAGALFRCFEATSLVNFPFEAMEAVKPAQVPGFTIPKEVVRSSPSQRDGIAMVVYPRLLASAFATIHALRDVLRCRLPIEIWFRPVEMQRTPAALQILQELAANDSAGGITLYEIDNPWATGFNAKIFAIYNSFFDHVLFLDADNVPVRDPTFLFESREFEETGAVFWPDFWHPGHTVFNIHNQSLVWELLGIPFVDMFEQESGQVLVDRQRHAAPLELVHFYAFHQPNHFKTLKVAYGDKDLFRFAWLKLGASFHMIQSPPAVAGKVINDSFCGMTMVQHDASGGVLFLHRNSHKLTGEVKRAYINVREAAKQRAMAKLRQQDPNGRVYPTGTEIEAELSTGTPAPTLWAPEPDDYPDAAIWTHLLSFRNTSSRDKYMIKGFHAEPEFPKWQNCYGQRKIGSNPNFFAEEIALTKFAGLETHLRRFAAEASQLYQTKSDQPTGIHTP